ncbi:hypothetical protein [Actinomycetospora sp. CA-053990]|uniref:hypothetical protein n=1 Tax=Actinomycetospora sp. CA-053990 TaxID=3239891 RepID=UPI003D91505C
MGSGVLMIDDAQTVRFRRGALPVMAPPRYATPPRPWGPPPAGLGGPGMPAPIVLPPLSTRPGWPWVLGAVAAVVVVLGLLGSVLAPSTTVSGTVTFYASNSLSLGSSCTGLGLYSDLRPGQSVVVYDDTGSQVGQGTLGSGTVVSSSGSVSYGYSGYGDACLFDYSVSGVAASDSYRVVVGQRNGVVFTSAQAEGHADISVGR